jgi:hypothetical protein
MEQFYEPLSDQWDRQVTDTVSDVLSEPAAWATFYDGVAILPASTLCSGRDDSLNPDSNLSSSVIADESCPDNVFLFDGDQHPSSRIVRGQQPKQASIDGMIPAEVRGFLHR